MEDTLGPDFYSIEDEDGNVFELELLDSLEHNGNLYHAFFPATPLDEDEEEGETEIDTDDEEEGLVILKVIQEDGEDLLSSLDDDQEVEEVYELFMERFFQDEEEE